MSPKQYCMLNVACSVLLAFNIIFVSPELSSVRDYVITHSVRSTGCPKINFTFLNVNNVRTNIRIATPAIYIDRRHL